MVPPEGLKSEAKRSVFHKVNNSSKRVKVHVFNCWLCVWCRESWDMSDCDLNLHLWPSSQRKQFVLNKDGCINDS